VNCRNALVNTFQSVMGLLLFASRTGRPVFRILNRLGVSTSYRTTVLRIHKLAERASKALCSVGYDEHGNKRYFLVVYDNINKHRKAWMAAFGKQSNMQNGTAQTAILLEDVPDGAFNTEPVLEACNKGLRRNLTTQRLVADINHDHLKRVGTGHVLRILVEHVPILQQYTKTVEQRFQSSYAIHRLPTRRSTIFPPQNL